MAGRGMGAATQGGGAVRSGPRNKVLKTRSKTTGIPMYAEGGNVKKPGKGAMSAKDIAILKKGFKKAAPKKAKPVKKNRGGMMYR